MSAGDTFENDILNLILRATAIANIADNAASSPLTNLYVSLHSGDVGEAGNQTTNEISYTGYARVAVARSTGFDAASGGASANSGTITFGTCTAGSATATHFAIGTASSGTGKVLLKGALGASVAISTGNPVASFAAGALDITCD